MCRRETRGLWATLFAAALAALVLGPAIRWTRALGFLGDLAAPPASPPAATPGPRIVERDLRIPGRGGPIRARLYFRDDHSKGRAIVVAHGVHHEGIDERRLVPFSRALARTGHVVITPELADLADYRITASGVDVIRDTVLDALRRSDHVEGERAGLLGFSFAGGLALVAASDPEVGRRLDYVASVGGHHDLARVLRFLVKNQVETPAGTRAQKAHEYGLVVLLYGHLERFVPASDLDGMRAVVKAWLEEERPRARSLAAGCKSAESERLWKLLEEGRVQTLAPELDAVLAAKSRELSALSPRGRLGTIEVPVYLLHGTHDSVIPPSEVDWAALELGAHPHDALVTPLIEHVSVARTATWDDRLALLRFIAHLL
jgi:dienelactone hydrolase